VIRLVRRTGLLALGAVLLGGCYSLRPLYGVEPQAGTRVAFDVNDAGRVALGGTVGPEIAQIQGRVVGREGEAYIVAVSAIKLLRGGEQVWTGEQVTLQPQHLGTAYERRVSVGRSVALGVATFGGFGLFLAGRALSVFGTGDDDGPPKDTVQQRLGRP